MPIVRVEGIPGNFDQRSLLEIERRIKETIASIPELGIEIDYISVLFPKDRLKNRAKKEVIATVDGLFIKPERTDEVRQDLADRVVNVLVEIFRQDVSLIECFVKPFDPKQGFASFSLQEVKEVKCEVHGSIEHMQSVTGICPGCGKK